MSEEAVARAEAEAEEATAREAEKALRARLLAPELSSLDLATVSAKAVDEAAFDTILADPKGPSQAPLVDVLTLIHGHAFVLPVRAADGTLEFRQVSSTEEDEDFDSVPPMDAVGLLDRLSELERWLLRQEHPGATPHEDGTHGFTVADKLKDGAGNGFQRLRHFPSPPPELLERREQDAARGASLPAWLETRVGPEHTLGEFRGGVVAVLPPGSTHFELCFYFRPDVRGRLFELPGDPRWGLAQAVREVTGALRLELALRAEEERYRWSMAGAPGESAWLRLEADGLDTKSSTLEALRTHLGME